MPLLLQKYWDEVERKIERLQGRRDSMLENQLIPMVFAELEESRLVEDDHEDDEQLSSGEESSVNQNSKESGKGESGKGESLKDVPEGSESSPTATNPKATSPKATTTSPEAATTMDSLVGGSAASGETTDGVPETTGTDGNSDGYRCNWWDGMPGTDEIPESTDPSPEPAGEIAGAIADATNTSQGQETSDAFRMLLSQFHEIVNGSTSSGARRSQNEARKS
jgi:hypothetical protein